ncbi:hypothetical protein FACS189437_03000 [Bacteroidia bacterium]|nr:hypothetical protein FACS189437_03000 [Bacteroidia bacterium]
MPPPAAAPDTALETTLLDAVISALPGAGPHIAQKAAKVFEGKTTPEKLAGHIKQIKENLIFNTPETDIWAAYVLLDKTTRAAAVAHLRTAKNREAVERFWAALRFSARTKETLISFYASPAAEMFFDAELAKIPGAQAGAEESLNAIKILEEKAESLKIPNRAQNNLADIEEYALKYRFPSAAYLTLTAYFNNAGARNFKEYFDGVFNRLQSISDNEKLNVFLTLKTLTGFLTEDDAAAFASLAREISYPLHHADIFTLGCRYMPVKTPEEVAATLEAVLARLPFMEIKEENLGMAVNVMTEASAECLEETTSAAQKNKELAQFRKALSKYDFFENFSYDIAKKFAGAAAAREVVEKFENILKKFIYCSGRSENNDLACKVLLDKITEEEASAQAAYRRDLKAKSLTKGLAPEVLKKYLGTMPPDEIVSFFEKHILKYSFWKTDSAKHLYALEALTAELNGTSSREISRFVLNALEHGYELSAVSGLLDTVTPKEKLKITESELKKSLPYPQRDGETLSSIFG